jgi:cell division protein FtsI/penicillin-binding protein 2
MCSLPRNRLFHVLLAMSIGICILAGRLLWLQATASFTRGVNDDVVSRSIRQRTEGVMLDSGRGHIQDRNGVPLTGVVTDGLLLLPGGADRLTGAERQALSRILQVPSERLINMWRSVTKPTWWAAGAGPDRPVPLTAEQALAIRRMRLSGAVVAQKVDRYAADRAAAHFVGFVAEQPERLEALYQERMSSGRLSLTTRIGASGLELAFDRFLQGQGGRKVVTYTDGAGRRLEGLGVRSVKETNRYYPLELRTTIDIGIQRSIEQWVDRYPMKEGAVVVLDAHTADIIAMVSRPAYETNRVYPKRSDWMNRGLQAVAPGSVMKTFIAAVALEEKIAHPNERFECDGTYEKYGLTCWKKGGHGELTFAEALAKSCNLVFAEVGERLSGETLERYADALGIMDKVGWSGTSSVDASPIQHLPEEQANSLFAASATKQDGGVMAQTSIGQRDVRWTPLAAANWMVTLLHGGTVTAPRAVSELLYADGHAVEQYTIKKAPSSVKLSMGTVHALRDMMEMVVLNGTGTLLQEADWSIAGKSGTAQVQIGGHSAVHQWFVGYGPAENPRYAVAIAALHRPPESPNQATALFKQVMDILARVGDPKK